MADTLSAGQQLKTARMCIDVALELLAQGNARAAREYARSGETALQRAGRSLERGDPPPEPHKGFTKA